MCASSAEVKTDDDESGEPVGVTSLYGYTAPDADDACRGGAGGGAEDKTAGVEPGDLAAAARSATAFMSAESDSWE